MKASSINNLIPRRLLLLHVS